MRRFPNIAVLFVTGYAGDASEAEGFADHELLRKPFTVGALLPAQGHTSLDFTVSAPSWASPGSWSAVVKVAAGDLVRTSPPIRVEVAG